MLLVRYLVLVYCKLKLVRKAIIFSFILIISFIDERFKKLVDGYLKKGLHKGVPPLFVDLRSLYKTSTKTAIIQELVLSYVNQLKETGHFSKEGKNFSSTIQVWLV